MVDNRSSRSSIPSLYELVPSLPQHVPAQAPMEPIEGSRYRNSFLLYLRNKVWIGYPASAYFAWVVLPDSGNTHWLASLVVMGIGFAVTGRLGLLTKAARRASAKVARSAERQHSLSGTLTDATQLRQKTLATPQAQFEQICLDIEQAGYQSASSDARMIVRSVATFGHNRSELVAIIDEALRHHLGFLNLLAQSRAQQGRFSFVRQQQQHSSRLAEEQISDLPPDLPMFYIGECPGFSGIRIGNIVIGDTKNFSGIRFGAFEIGERRAPRTSSQEQGSGQTKWPEPTKWPDQAQSPGSVGRQSLSLPASESDLQNAALQSTSEIHFIRLQCEEMLVKSVQGDTHRMASDLRVRLLRERMVQDELEKFGL